MKLTRRNTLIGLGTIVAGGGAALGTGAFSSVEADRTVSFETTGDAAALLAFVINSETLQGEDGNDDRMEIDADDLNEGATTTFDDAVTVTNNGENDVGLSVSGLPEAVTITSDGTDLESEVVDLDAGESGAVDLDVVFDPDDEESVDEETITFRAAAEDHSTNV